MHELSIALGMIDEVARIALDNNARKVVTVKLKVGKRSGIVIDSLKFAFDAVKLEYPLLSSTAMIVEEVPLTYTCNHCKNTFSPQRTCLPIGRSAEADKTYEMYLVCCPECKSYNLKLLSGEEMHIESLEVEV